MLTVLVTLEATFDDDLLDLYLYYAVIGLGMSSSRLRAAATSMLPTLAAHNPPTILRLLPRLSALAADGWWEVQAQTARVCVSLLAQPAALDAAAAAELTRLLCGALASRNPSVAAVALSEAAPLLATSPDLLEPSLRALLLLPPPQRAALLLPSADAPALPLTSASYALAPLPASWPALAVARELLAGVKSAQLPCLEPAHAEVIAALATGALDDHGRDGWREWFLGAKDYLYVALCDPELCDTVCAALLGLYTYLGEEALPTFSTLLSSLRMLFSADAGAAGSTACQAAAVAFLLKVHELGDPFAKALSLLVSEFDGPMRESQLSEVVARVGA